MSEQLSRRQTLLALAFGGIAALGAAGGITVAFSTPETDPLSERLLQMLPDRRNAARIGATWLQRHPEFTDSNDVLPEHLAARLKTYGWTEDDGALAGGDTRLGNAVTTIVRDEFLRGEVEDIQGWRISNFQAELCGLAYLIGSKPHSV